MHKFNPENIGRLIGEDRERELPPKAFLINQGLKEGTVFADIGCGPGFFSIPATKIVGSTGKVLAVDLQEERLEKNKAVSLIEETDFTVEKISSLCNGSHYCITTRTS